jgi:glycosyltransferase involved in cell wall biosynthesis
MASYNHARFLPAALDSIFGQTLGDFELIAVDDGSTDESLEILHAYADRNPGMMRVLTHPGHQNLGISVTVNLATSEARGVYWCGHDSDDISYPDRLERQVAFLEARPEIGWVYGLADFIDKDGAPLHEQFGCDLTAVPDLVEELLVENRIASPTLLVRMECLREVGPFEPGLVYSDGEYWVRLAARYPAAFLPGAVVGYRYHDSNVSLYPPQRDTLQRSLESYRWSLAAIASLRRKADAGDRQLGQPRKKALLDLSRAAYLLLAKDKDSASRAAAAVFRSDPSFRRDLKQLAYCLNRFKSLRLPLLMIRELGYPPRWLASPAFLSALWRIAVYRLRHR